MHVPWDDLQLFLAVADARSLTAAARKLRITQPTASRRLQELEARLGEPLFVRGVSGTALTSYGERLLEPARRMAEWAGEVERVAEHAEVGAKGVVRLTAPPGIAFDFVAPFAAWLREREPELRLEVLSTIQYLDLARREADLALRIAKPTQRDLLVLASVEMDVEAMASPAYVARLPPKPSFADVDWIGWAPPFDHISPNPELAQRIPGFRPSFASDDFLVQLRALSAGLGAMFLTKPWHRFAMPGLELARVPVALPPLRRPMHLVCAKSALDVPRVRLVAELLVREIERPRPRRAPRQRAG